jgi:hypothetical protein
MGGKTITADDVKKPMLLRNRVECSEYLNVKSFICSFQYYFLALIKTVYDYWLDNFVVATVWLACWDVQNVLKKAGDRTAERLYHFIIPGAWWKKWVTRMRWFFVQFIPVAGAFITIWMYQITEHFGGLAWGIMLLLCFLPFIYFLI